AFPTTPVTQVPPAPAPAAPPPPYLAAPSVAQPQAPPPAPYLPPPPPPPAAPVPPGGGEPARAEVHRPRVSLPRSAGMVAANATAAQRAHLADLIQRFTARTRTSKEITARHRRVLADSRAVVGFRDSTKEMLYPIAARRAKGAVLEDVDGNTYVDITMGFGALLYGHE